MVQRVDKYGLKIEEKLYNFINSEVLNNLNFDSEQFWNKFSGFIKEFAPKNKLLLEKRLELKKKIDNWHIENKAKDFDKEEYKSFLKLIGYLVTEGDKFSINTSNVDKEISEICGPQNRKIFKACHGITTQCSWPPRSSS